MELAVVENKSQKQEVVVETEEGEQQVSKQQRQPMKGNIQSLLVSGTWKQAGI